MGCQTFTSTLVLLQQKVHRDLVFLIDNPEIWYRPTLSRNTRLSPTFINSITSLYLFFFSFCSMHLPKYTVLFALNIHHPFLMPRQAEPVGAARWIPGLASSSSVLLQPSVGFLLVNVSQLCATSSFAPCIEHCQRFDSFSCVCARTNVSFAVKHNI